MPPVMRADCEVAANNLPLYELEQCPLMSLPAELQKIIHDYYFQQLRQVNLARYRYAAPSPALPQMSGRHRALLEGKHVLFSAWFLVTPARRTSPWLIDSLSVNRIEAVNRILIKTVDTASRTVILELAPVSNRDSGSWKFHAWHRLENDLDKGFLLNITNAISAAARDRKEKARWLATALIDRMDRSAFLTEKLLRNARLSAAEQQEVDAAKGSTPSMLHHVDPSRGQMKKEDLKVIVNVCLRDATC